MRTATSQRFAIGVKDVISISLHETDISYHAAHFVSYYIISLKDHVISYHITKISHIASLTNDRSSRALTVTCRDANDLARDR